jgi:hypothetical protein
MYGPHRLPWPEWLAFSLAMARSAYVLVVSANHPAVAEVAALVGNPARADILMALMDGRALTASELAYAAGAAS